MVSVDNCVEDLMQNSDFISVVMPSYNHAEHIAKAIESVLAQSYRKFEFLISDDASSDESWEVISKYQDVRIRTFQQLRNLGPVGNLNYLIKQARGKYVALLNSDDLWQHDKLEKQISIMDSHPDLGACFTWAEMIDERGNQITGPEAMWNDVFRQENRSQGQWLRHFFLKGNCLCHPSILIRREVYDFLGPYNPGFNQLPDFEMWIRLVKNFPIYIIQEDLVTHLRNGQNTSAVSPENSARNLTELVEIFRTYFNGTSDTIFINGFSDMFRLKLPILSASQLKCEKFFLLFDSAFAYSAGRSAAISYLMVEFSDKNLERVLRDEYCFNIFDFYRATGNSGFGHALMMHGSGAMPNLNDRNVQAIDIWKAFYRAIFRVFRQ